MGYSRAFIVSPSPSEGSANECLSIQYLELDVSFKLVILPARPYLSLANKVALTILMLEQ